MTEFIQFLLMGLGIGIFGVATPGMPGTVFLLMATALFFRSNERMYRWVMSNPRFGPMIRSYRAGHGIPRRIKVVAIGEVTASALAQIGLPTHAQPIHTPVEDDVGGCLRPDEFD